MSIAVDPRGWVACGHLRVLHVFSATELSGKVHVGYMVGLLLAYLYIQGKDSGGLVLVCGMPERCMGVWIRKTFIL